MKGQGGEREAGADLEARERPDDTNRPGTDRGLSIGGGGVAAEAGGIDTSESSKRAGIVREGLAIADEVMKEKRLSVSVLDKIGQALYAE